MPIETTGFPQLEAKLKKLDNFSRWINDPAQESGRRGQIRVRTYPPEITGQVYQRTLRYFKSIQFSVAITGNVATIRVFSTGATSPLTGQRYERQLKIAGMQNQYIVGRWPTIDKDLQALGKECAMLIAEAIRDLLND